MDWCILSGFFGKLSLFEIIVAIAAFFGSFYSIYKAHWERPRLQVLPGDRLALVSPLQPKVCFNIMLEVVNYGTKTGVLRFLQARLESPDQKQRIFEWNEFYKYLPSGTVVQKDKDPHPISVPARDSRSLAVQFAQAPSSSNFQWQRANILSCSGGGLDTPELRIARMLTQPFISLSLIPRLLH